jgi:hypothetical protein
VTVAKVSIPLKTRSAAGADACCAVALNSREKVHWSLQTHRVSSSL